MGSSIPRCHSTVGTFACERHTMILPPPCMQLMWKTGPRSLIWLYAPIDQSSRSGLTSQLVWWIWPHHADAVVNLTSQVCWCGGSDPSSWCGWSDPTSLCGRSGSTSWCGESGLWSQQCGTSAPPPPIWFGMFGLRHQLVWWVRPFHLVCWWHKVCVQDKASCAREFCGSWDKLFAGKGGKMWPRYVQAFAGSRPPRLISFKGKIFPEDLSAALVTNADCRGPAKDETRKSSETLDSFFVSVVLNILQRPCMEHQKIMLKLRKMLYLSRSHWNTGTEIKFIANGHSLHGLFIANCCVGETWYGPFCRSKFVWISTLRQTSSPSLRNVLVLKRAGIFGRAACPRTAGMRSAITIFGSSFTSPLWIVCFLGGGHEQNSEVSLRKKPMVYPQQNCWTIDVPPPRAKWRKLSDLLQGESEPLVGPYPIPTQETNSWFALRHNSSRQICRQPCMTCLLEILRVVNIVVDQCCCGPVFSDLLI